MEIDVKELQSAFFEDAADRIEELEHSLNVLANHPEDQEAFDTLFRTVHTLKGDSAAVGFETISELMHQCEGTLQPMRQGLTAMTPGAVDTVGLVFDQLIELIEGMQIIPEEATPVGSLEVIGFSADPETLCDFISESNEHLDSAEEQLLVIESDPDNKDALNSIYCSFHSIKGLSSFLGLESIRLLAHHAESMLNVARESRLQLAGEAFELALSSIDAVRVQLGLAEGWLSTGKLMTDPQLDDLVQKLESISGSTESSSADKPMDRQAEPSSEAPESLNLPEKQSVPSRNSMVTSRDTIKVDRERLDHLINVIGELVIGHAMLEEEASKRLDSQNEIPALARVNKTVRDLQELSLSLRMVPVAPAFQKMARIVRDLARKLGKEIHFSTDGDDTELDKTVVDQIGDPLLHMVRNAVDHGLESALERQAAGKSSHGTIALRAFHQGGNIYIEIEDDGRGLDREQILEKAIERNVISPNANLCDSEIFELIFAPGFSTASEVTDVSGRGVGMDVVRRSVESLHGHVSIESEAGVGTTMTIRLPLTLAILDGLSVRVSDETYILPILSVVESYEAAREDVRDIAGKGEVVVVRGDVIPLLRLGELLQAEVLERDQDTYLVVIVEERGKRFALLVDELLGQSQVVIKNLQTNYRKVEGVAGATILGNGRVAMILDLCSLFAMSHRFGNQTPARTVSTVSAADDSFSIMEPIS